MMLWSSPVASGLPSPPTTPSIQRVVSTFLLWNSSSNTTNVIHHDEPVHMAVFHRVSTMPTFAGHWAACSGSIEPGEAPWQTAVREVQEETNVTLSLEPRQQYGIYVDVPYRQDRIIRVYPFVVAVPAGFTNLELRGTEHDEFRWVSVAELENELTPTVPALATGFHHATAGRYLSNLTADERKWAQDRTSGAAVLARQAVELVATGRADPRRLRLLRPSMVAIVNAMTLLVVNEDKTNKGENAVSPSQVLEALKTEAERAIDYAVERLVSLITKQYQAGQPVRLATFSRSSTVVAVVKRILAQEERSASAETHPEGGSSCASFRIARPILCGKSTPGDEGELMAHDLNDDGGDADITAQCVDDEELLESIGNKQVDWLLVGSDAVLTDGSAVVNKIGTARLAEAAATSSSECRIVCCADRFKLWDDVFPPPLEEIFEVVPSSLVHELLVPPPQEEAQDM